MLNAKRNGRVISLKNCDMADSKKNSCKKDPKDYIINEAQMVISNYISNIEAQNKVKYKQKGFFEDSSKFITDNKNAEKDNKNKILKMAGIVFIMLLIVGFIII